MFYIPKYSFLLESDKKRRRRQALNVLQLENSVRQLKRKLVSFIIQHHMYGCISPNNFPLQILIFFIVFVVDPS